MQFRAGPDRPLAGHQERPVDLGDVRDPLISLAREYRAAPWWTLVPSRAEPEPVLEGVVLDPVAARKLGRDQRFRESPDGIMLHFLNSRG